MEPSKLEQVIQKIERNSEENSDIDRLDVRAVINTLKAQPEHLFQDILDTLHAIHKLYKKGMITEPTEKRLLAKYEKTTEPPSGQFCDLFCDLFSVCSLTNIVLFLRFNKFDRLASDIEKHREISPTGRGDDGPGTRKLVRYCNRMKLNFDNNIFHDSKDKFQYMVKERRLCLHSNRLSVSEIVVKAEEYLVTNWVYINSLRDAPFDERMTVLKQMIQYTPRGMDRAVDAHANLLFLTKEAVTHALSGRWKEALEGYRRAKCLVRSISQHFVAVLVYHDLMYIYRLRYIDTSDREDLEAAIEMGTVGIKTARKLYQHDCLAWIRLFKIYKAMLFLSIGPKLTVDLGYKIPIEDRRKAISLLTYVAEKDYSKDISHREEIDYFMCQARIFDEEGDLTRALEYARKAIEHAGDGTPFPEDIVNAGIYMDYLKLKQFRICVLILTHCLLSCSRG